MKSFFFLTLFSFSCCIFFISGTKAQLVNEQKIASLKINFSCTVDQQLLQLDSIYTNCWNETFSINRLKYYISNVQLQTADKKDTRRKNDYYLIDQEDSTSNNILLSVDAKTYTGISFLIGVDSIKNVSGAQSGALDPLNGMFWTWNSGYIMFKIEGSSPQSASVYNKLEYHIGGFAGKYNVLRRVQLNFPAPVTVVNNAGQTTILLAMELNKIWNAQHPLRITQNPVCTTPGAIASTIADNFANLFSIVKINKPS